MTAIACAGSPSQAPPESRDSDPLPGVTIRASQLNDVEQIGAVLSGAGLRPAEDPREFGWKYWCGRPDWPSPRSFVMTRGSEILAHAGVMPGRCLSETGSVSAIHLADWAARADAPGSGVALMKHISRSADAMIAIGGSEQTMRILPNLGFRCLGKVTRYVRPLRPLQILRHVEGAKWRRWTRATRGLVWALAAPDEPGSGHVHRVDTNEIADAELALPAPSGGMAVFERGLPLLKHALACPMTTMELFAWEGSKAERGYFMLALTAAQTRLVDCWTPSTDITAWQNLVHMAVKQAQMRADAIELVTLASDSLLRAALISCGFRARGSYPIHWMPRHDGVPIINQLRVQMLDNDTAYLHRGRVEFWL